MSFHVLFLGLAYFSHHALTAVSVPCTSRLRHAYHNSLFPFNSSAGERINPPPNTCIKLKGRRMCSVPHSRPRVIQHGDPLASNLPVFHLSPPCLWLHGVKNSLPPTLLQRRLKSWFVRLQPAPPKPLLETPIMLDNFEDELSGSGRETVQGYKVHGAWGAQVQRLPGGRHAYKDVLSSNTLQEYIVLGCCAI